MKKNGLHPALVGGANLNRLSCRNQGRFVTVFDQSTNVSERK